MYAGKVFTSIATGRRVIHVSCEKCGREFYYELVRHGVGSASAPYYLGQGSAKRRAETSAQKKLKRRLDRESELVPCPKCNWVNESMIEGFRRTSYRQLGSYAWALGAIVTVAMFVTLSLINSKRPDGAAPLVAVAVAVGTGAVCAAPLLLVQYFLRHGINPNRTYPRKPVLPLATPKAWTAEELAAPAKVSNKSELSENAGTPAGEWAMFRAGQLVIPDQWCCECLAPAVTTYKSPYRVDDRPRLQAPLCAECSSRLRRQWWTTALLTAGGATLASGLLYLVMKGGEGARLTIAIVFAIFALIISLAMLPNWLTQPYKIRTVDASRGIFRIIFRSEQFTEMVRKASADDERSTFQPAATRS